MDDDPNILDTAQDILEDAGYTVRGVSTAAAALKFLQSNTCDLMIVDFNLPDAKGLDLAAEARQMKPDLVVILMTGQSPADLGSDQSMVHASLTKPVAPKQLLDVLTKFLH